MNTRYQDALVHLPWTEQINKLNQPANFIFFLVFFCMNSWEWDEQR